MSGVGEEEPRPEAGGGRETRGGRKVEIGPGLEPCFRCGVPLPVRRMGCRGGHCPNCDHPYPHGDCSD